MRKFLLACQYCQGKVKNCINQHLLTLSNMKNHRSPKTKTTSTLKRPSLFTQENYPRNNNNNQEPSHPHRILNKKNPHSSPPPCRSKSLSPNNSRLIRQDFSVYMDHLIQQMTVRKEKLEKYIKIFNLMQNHNAPIRCIEHNNTLTIYCQTERKSLCANCVYGFSRHRTHKLVPLKDSFHQIMEDNNSLWMQVNGDMKKMDLSVKAAQENTSIFEREMKEKIRQVDEEYLKKADDLKQKCEKKKQRIIDTYDQLAQKSRNIEKIVEEFKVKVWQILSKIGIGKKADENNSESQIGKQVICESISSITNIEIRNIVDKQLEKIKQKINKF